jgi:hypothetical protein
MKTLPVLDSHQQDAFWKEVASKEIESCWNWTGYILKSGYGQIKIDYINYRSHRIAYYLTYDIDPVNRFVCHSCDNPRCCNPNHLFLGTPLDNSTDMVLKERVAHQKGEKHGQAKLTEAQVYFILKSSETPTKLAPRFGISPSLVSKIRHRKVWKHVKSP